MAAAHISLVLPAASRAQWSASGVLLFAPPADPTGVLPMADGRGGLYVVDYDYRDLYGTGADVYLQHLDAGGYRYPGWPASGLPVCVMRDFQAVAGFAPDGLGGILLAWRDDRDPSSTGADIFAQRVRDDGSLPPGWTENGVPACRDSGYQQLSPVYYTGIGSDGAGGAFVSWDDYRADPIGLTPDVYVQHLLTDGSRDTRWPPDGRPACIAPPGSSGHAIIPDGEGGTVVVFGDGRRGIPEPFDVDIYGQRILADGSNAPGWPDEGRLLVSRFASMRGVLPDDAGGFYVVRSRMTEESHPYDAEIWVHRFTFDGERAAGWPEEGVLVAGGPGSRPGVRVERDALGGVVFAWWELRPGQWPEIYVSRIRPDGSLPLGWPPSGLRVSNPASYPYNDFDPAVTYDGTGGLYVTWCRDYNATGPSYIQHITAAGMVAPGWPEYGHVVASTDEQSNPQIVSDGSGGAIVVWQSNYSEFYATRFAADGPVAASVSLARSEALADRVALEWRTSERSSFAATLERSEREREWRALAMLSPDGEGRLGYEDRDVTPGRRYGYRLAWDEAGARITSQEVWLDVPGAPRFTLAGARPNPAPRASLRVAFSLAEPGSACLELFDLQGRVVSRRDLPSIRAGFHVEPLEQAGSLPGGLYWLRLTQGANAASARVVLVE